MKFLKSIILCGMGIAALTLTSCNDWLDVNTDPENPSGEAALYQQRLAHIEFYTNSGIQFGAWRNTMACGDWTRAINNGGTYYNMSIWYPTSSISTTPYQWWFVGAYANVPDMYEKAMAAGNYAYAGVARVIKAYGMMDMTDLYGEMPYTQAVGEQALPEYDTGKTIFMGCIADIEEGIELLEKAKSQPADLPALSEGDWWNNGSIDKWTKLAYLLKARWLNHLKKKGAGSYKDGKYDVDEIMRCLDMAMKSNADNTVINHTDDNGTTRDNLGWDEPVDYSPLYSVCGMNAGYMATKMLADNLTNFGGYGVEDPRADLILPWATSVKSENSPEDIVWRGNWRRTRGVDMNSNIQLQGGPIRASYSTAKGFWIDSSNEDRLGDTVYVESTSESKGYAAKPDLFYRRGGVSANNSRESGSFYSRVSAPTYVGTYMEVCFIKAEIYFNQGNKAQAFAEYKKGIQASLELMNEKVAVWAAEDPSLVECPSFQVMTADEINNYLANGIGNANDITLGHIMTQKRLALMFSMEIWNDMRRYDYNPNIFFGWHVPAQHFNSAAAMLAIPQGKDFRRWRQCSHEYNYNSAQLQAIGYQVPGANMTLNQWNLADDVWTIPVWWDSDQP